MDIRITGAQALLPGGLEVAPVHISPADGVISGIGSDQSTGRTIDADGLYLLLCIFNVLLCPAFPVEHKKRLR